MKKKKRERKKWRESEYNQLENEQFFSTLGNDRN